MSKRRRRSSGKITKKSNRSETERAKLAYKQGNYDKAILILQSAKESANHKRALAELYFRRAQRYYDQQPDQAIQDLERAATIQPHDALYAYHVGVAHHYHNKLADAIEWYQQSLERDSGFERVHFPLAIALSEAGDNVKQKPIWQTLTDDQKAYLSDGVAANDDLLQSIEAAQNSDWDNAKDHFQVITSDETTASAQVQAVAHDHLGRITLQQNADALTQALSHWEKAYDNDLRSPALLDNLALAYTLRIEALLAIDDISSARELAQQAIQYFPDHTRLQEIQSHLLLRAGYNAAVESDWQSALDHWESVENAESEVARRLAANLALAYEAFELWGQAADSWREFARRRGRKEGADNWLSPTQVARLWSRISNLYMRAGQDDDAVTTLKTALKYDPDDLDMGVELARRYAESGRTEAAHNQIDRVLKKHPNSAKALAFKAELSEIAPQGWGFINQQAISAWKKVIATDDEAYAPVARQSLKNLYLDELLYVARWGFNTSLSLNLAEEALEQFPDFTLLRANYIGIMLEANKSKKAIESELNKFDFTDDRALHRLIDILHIFDQHDLADDVLSRANTQVSLSAQFYAGIGRCAIDRQQYDIADSYFKVGTDIADNASARHLVLTEKASAYYEIEENNEAERILKNILKEDAHFGPAHLLYALIDIDKDQVKDAKWHLKKVERWANREDDSKMLDLVERIRASIDNPFGSLFPPGFDPSMLPPDLDLDRVFGDEIEDNDFDEDKS